MRECRCVVCDAPVRPAQGIMRRPCLMTDYLIVHRAAEAHTKMGNQDKFMHETAILLLSWMYDIRHTRPHVFHHECANEFEEGMMAHVLSDYDMAPASAAWPRVRSVRAGRWHAQPTASRLRGIQVRSRCACAPRISATLSCGAGRSRSGSCAPGLVASICARSASQPIPRNGVGPGEGPVRFDRTRPCRHCGPNSPRHDLGRAA